MAIEHGDRGMSARLLRRGFATAIVALATVMSDGTASANPGGGGGAPEIDAGSAMSALTVMTGGILLITDRIRRRRSSN